MKENNTAQPTLKIITLQVTSINIFLRLMDFRIHEHLLRIPFASFIEKN